MSKNIFAKLIMSIIVIIILTGSVYTTSSYALGDVFSSGKEFLDKGKIIEKTIDVNALESTSDYIYNTLFAIATMIAIIVAMALGIQFMVASAEEKAKVKEALMPFVVGCIVVFGSFTIWKVIVNIGNNTEDAIQTTSQEEYEDRMETQYDETIKKYQSWWGGNTNRMTEANVRSAVEELNDNCGLWEWTSEETIGKSIYNKCIEFGLIKEMEELYYRKHPDY